MHPDRLAPSLIAALLLACGPTPATTADASATSTSTGSETTGGVSTSTTLTTTQSPTESPSSSGGPAATTTTVASEVTVTVTTAPGDTGDTIDTCGFICSDTDIECQIVPGLDGALRCSQCDPWTQNCPEGEKCSAWANDGGSAWNATRCSPVAVNAHQPGEPCTVEGNGVSGIDDCALGAMCWNVAPGTLEGTCVGLCDGSPRDPSCAEPGTACLLANDGVLNLCLPTCDPLAIDCPEGQVCVSAGTDDFFCATGTPGEVGAPCEFLAACDPGLACIQSDLLPGCEGNSCCSPFCSVPGPNTCPDAPNQVCTPWFEPGMAPAGHEDVGVCTLPQP